MPPGTQAARFHRIRGISRPSGHKESDAHQRSHPTASANAAQPLKKRFDYNFAQLICQPGFSKKRKSPASFFHGRRVSPTKRINRSHNLRKESPPRRKRYCFFGSGRVKYHRFFPGMARGNRRFQCRARRDTGKGNQGKILSDPVTVSGENGRDMPLCRRHEKVRIVC